MKQLFYSSWSGSSWNWQQLGQRCLMAIAIVMLCLQALAQPVLATGVYNIPTLDPAKPTWVLDQASVVSLINQGKLDKTLSNLAEQTGKEVRMVSVRRLDYGETPDSFAQKLFEKWFPTTESQANQVLIVLDTVTNGTAIRTGEQVRDPLTDAIALPKKPCESHCGITTTTSLFWMRQIGLLQYSQEILILALLRLKLLLLKALIRVPLKRMTAVPLSSLLFC
jgi:hypothetical protein